MGKSHWWKVPGEAEEQQPPEVMGGGVWEATQGWMEPWSLLAGPGSTWGVGVQSVTRGLDRERAKDDRGDWERGTKSFVES